VQHDDRVEAQSSPRLACSVLSLAGVRPSLCQEAASEIPPTTVQAAADNPETDKVLAEFSKALDEWTAKIATEEQTIAAPSTSDNELRRIPDLLESLQTLAVRTRSVGEHPTQAQSQTRSASAPISTATATWWSGSSTRSSSVGGSRPDTTSSPPTTSPSSSSPASAYGCAFYECTA
jgi:hypothetical protein